MRRLITHSFRLKVLMVIATFAWIAAVFTLPRLIKSDWLRDVTKSEAGWAVRDDHFIMSDGGAGSAFMYLDYKIAASADAFRRGVVFPSFLYAICMISLFVAYALNRERTSQFSFSRLDKRTG